MRPPEVYTSSNVAKTLLVGPLYRIEEGALACIVEFDISLVHLFDSVWSMDLYHIYLLSPIMFIPADYSRYQAGCVPGIAKYMGPKDRTFLRAAFIMCRVMVDRQSPNS